MATVHLHSCDGRSFEVDETVTKHCPTISRQIKPRVATPVRKPRWDEVKRPERPKQVISLPTVTSEQLDHVIRYCHAVNGAGLKEFRDFDSLGPNTVMDIFEAAVVLEMEELKHFLLKDKFLTLCSQDGESYVVEALPAMVSGMLKELMRSPSATETIRLPIASVCLSAVREYIHNVKMFTEPEINAVNKNFVKFHHKIIFDLVRAASFLEVEGLLHLVALPIANMFLCPFDEAVKRCVECSYTRSEEEQLAITVGENLNSN